MTSPDEPGIWRYRDVLPVDRTLPAVSLGEGNTPLLPSTRTGHGPSVSFKMESANPTWSHKDRLASLGVSVARAQGAEAMIVGSSGNQGAAAAAYCARAGLPCIVLTTPDIPPQMRVMIQTYGAMLFTVPTAADRGALVAEALPSRNWFALSGYVDPPVGSNASAVPAYATIAYELFEQTDGSLPDVIVAPTSHGDTLAGMWAGFNQLKELFGLTKLPRLIAVEPFGSLERTLREESPLPLEGRQGETRALSIAGRRSTPRALKAVLDSGGTAVQIDDADMSEAHHALGRQGLFVEPSSAMAAGALPTLIERNAIHADEHAVVLITSSGLKDPSYGADAHGDVPMIEPKLAELTYALESEYSFMPQAREPEYSVNIPG